jgi:hypothetical protein
MDTTRNTITKQKVRESLNELYFFCVFEIPETCNVTGWQKIVIPLKYNDDPLMYLDHSLYKITNAIAQKYLSALPPREIECFGEITGFGFPELTLFDKDQFVAMQTKMKEIFKGPFAELLDTVPVKYKQMNDSVEKILNKLSTIFDSEAKQLSCPFCGHTPLASDWKWKRVTCPNCNVATKSGMVLCKNN